LTGFALDAIWQIYLRLAGTLGRDAAPGGLPYVYELCLDTLRTQRYPILADSLCPLCARPSPDTAEAAVLTLRSREKRGIDDYRIRSVTDYDLPLYAFANPVSGMLGTVAAPDFSSQTVSAVTGYFYVRDQRHLRDFFWSGHADRFSDSAMLAVCEGLERYAGLLRTRVTDLVVDCYDNIAHVALDPRECGVYSDDFYRDANYFTSFRTDLRMPWVWGYSLRDERPVLVPERIAYYLSRDDGSAFVQECSNGCAAGSCLEEAILYGMLELIERDAFLLAWYGKARLAEIDPASCRSTATRIMIDRIWMEGYDVRLFDNRIDLPIPVVTAVASRQDGGLGALCLASGASFDPEEAVRGALCEIATYIPQFQQRTTRNLAEVKSMAADYRQVTDLHHHPLLFGLPEMAQHADFLLGERREQPIHWIYHDWDQIRPRNRDLLDDLRYCKDRLVDAGFDVIAIDQTSPEQRSLGLRTACVIVPGLIPIDFGWARQRVLHMPRMRSAFRNAGWRGTDLADEELHQVPHPFP
jgi:ribosomal protein S12 methylthiotransferase accessory factor